MPSSTSTNLTTHQPNPSKPIDAAKFSKQQTPITQGVPPTPRKAPSQRENASPFRTQKVFRPGPYPSTWLLQRRNDLDAAFERAWAAYTTVYNREFKTHTSTEEIRERMMAGHNIHGEDVLLPRPTVEHRLTRRKKRQGGHGMGG